MAGFGFLPILLLAGGGLYLMTRKESGAASPPTSIDMNAADALDKRFLAALVAFSKTQPTFNDDDAAEARKSFVGDDRRALAVALAEFAMGGAETPVTPSAEASKRLAIDCRDRFQLLDGKGALADKVIAAVVAFAAKIQTLTPEQLGAFWGESTNLAAIDKAMIDLLVDAPYFAQMGAPITGKGPFPCNLVDPKTGEARATGVVDVNSDYKLASLAKNLGGGSVVEGYMGRIVIGTIDGSDIAGRYVVTFVPAG